MTNDQDRPASQSETGPVRPPMAGQADGNDATPDSQANVMAQHGQTGLLLELMREMRGQRESFQEAQRLAAGERKSEHRWRMLFQDAGRRVNYLIGVNGARYYVKRGAYIAAANRAQFAIMTYPQAPAIEEAMFIMVTAYDKMGMNDLRDDADRVMKKNFPTSRFYKDGLTRKTAWWHLW